MQKPKLNSDGTITVRIKATAQVIDMVPSAAYPMLNGGIAEVPESMVVEPTAERAVLPMPRKKSSTASRRA